MDPITISGVLVLVTLILIPTFWYYYCWLIRENKQKLFAERNVDYIEFPNLFVTTWRRDRLEVQRDNMIQKIGKKTYGFVELLTNIILTAEPDLIQQVMSKEFTNFTNRRDVQFYDKIFRNAVSAAKDEQWKRLRSIITPAFSTGKIRRMKPNIDSTIQTMVKNFDQAINKSEIVEIKRMFSSFTIDTIVQISFGIKVDSCVDENVPIISYAQKLLTADVTLKAMVEFAIMSTLPKMANLFNFGFNQEAIDYFDKIAIEIVKKKREEIDTGKAGKASNFIELLLEVEKDQQNNNEEQNDNSEMMIDEHSNESSNEMESSGLIKKSTKFITNDEVVAQCMLFFLAGFESTASAITFASYLLAINPEIQKKLYDEIVTVLESLSAENSNDRNAYNLVTFETLSKFEYLTAVMNETLRIYSPAPVIDRTASKDITLQTDDGKTKIFVKKGDLILIPIYSLHKDPEHFPEPETFMPERFIEEPYKSFHKYAYLPFGNGPRNCVARSFALLEIKMAVLHTVLRYKLDICHMTKIPCEFFYNSNFLTPKNINLKFEKRTNINFDH